MSCVEGTLDDLELLVILATDCFVLIGRNPVSLAVSPSSVSGLGVEARFDSCNDAYSAFFSSRSSFQDNPAVISYIEIRKENISGLKASTVYTQNKKCLRIT